MKKKLISLLQRKRHIVALSTILMTFIVMSCLFIDSVDITQMIDGKAVNYAKAGTTATFKMHGHIKVQGDPRNDKRLVFGFLAPKSWNLAQNARVSYTEDTFDPNIGEQNMTLIPLTEQPSNKNQDCHGRLLSCRNTVSVPIFWKIWNGQPIGQDPITVSQMKFILQSMSVYR